jgi:hypothetical protein
MAVFGRYWPLLAVIGLYRSNFGLFGQFLGFLGFFVILSQWLPLVRVLMDLL